MKKVLAPALLLAISSVGCAHNPVDASMPTDWNFCYRGMKDDAIFLAGQSGRDCGFASLKSTAGQRSLALKCALAEAKGAKPFRVGYQDIGTDSGFCEIAILTPDKRWIVLDVDYDRSGGVLIGDGPRLGVLECEHLVFAPGRRSLFSQSGCNSSPKVRATLPTVER